MIFCNKIKPDDCDNSRRQSRTLYWVDVPLSSEASSVDNCQSRDIAQGIIFAFTLTTDICDT